MSSHAAEVRAVLQTRPDVRLPDVMAALEPFCRRWGIRLNRNDDGEYGLLEAHGSDYSDVHLTTAGVLGFHLFCYMNVGMPDELDTLLENLNELVTDAGGVIEIVDLDTSPSNDEAIALRCIGATEEIRKQALIRFVFERAWDVISPLVPRETFDTAVDLCVKATHKAEEAVA